MKKFALIVSVVGLGILAACAGSSDDGSDSEPGTGEGNLTTAKQLFGNDLPDHTLSLTFDDGPGPRTVELADFLAENNIKGTFFMNGKNAAGALKGSPAHVVQKGHLLANHTQNHLQLTKLSSSQLLKEIGDTDKIIAEVQPNGPFLIRAPFGAWSANVSQTVNGSPFKKYVGSVFWDEGGELTATAAADWACWGKKLTVERCGQLYLQEIRAKKKGIVLMHDVHNKTVDMVKLILPQLIKDGFKFVRADHVPSIEKAIVAGGGTVPVDPPAGAAEGDDNHDDADQNDTPASGGSSGSTAASPCDAIKDQDTCNKNPACTFFVRPQQGDDVGSVCISK
jgi:peptidoglycan/xylan/chitin deacetylase (PgdA/CDA1 family)